MAKFLDENGVKKLWSRIQEYVYECCCSKGGGDVGYECKDGYETFWKGNVTTRDSTEGDWAYNQNLDQVIDAEKIRVIFQGTAYDLERNIAQTSAYTYYEYGEFTSEGEPILTNLPIAIQSRRIRTDNVLKANSGGMLRAGLRLTDGTTIFTRTSGSYNIEIQIPGTIVETTECFQKAVKSISGYDCTTSFEKAFSESGATTMGEDSDFAEYVLKPTSSVDTDEIKVVFNGTEYTCSKQIEGDAAMYGATDTSFTDYPFMLGFSESEGNVVFTKEPMDFSVTVFAAETTVTVTPCFEKAVRMANTPFIVRLSASLTNASCEGNVYATTQFTYDQIYEAFDAGRNVFFVDPALGALMVTMLNTSRRTVGVYAKVDDNVKLFEFVEYGGGRMRYPNCQS